MMTLMIASAAVGAVGAVAGAATGIAGGIQSYNQQKENAKAQQNMLEYNARLERREAEAEEAEKAGEAGGRGETEPAKAAAAQGNVIAYGAVVFDGEPAYDAIEGAWLTDGEYVVLHRMAVADGEKGRGVATEFMRRVEAMACGRGTGSMRVDTNFDNRYMLRMLGRLGFVYCGKVRYRSGERLAFEKTLGT